MSTAITLKTIDRKLSRVLRLVPKPAMPSKSLGGLSLPALKEGEKYKGLILDEHGKPKHHVILLPGELERATHGEATKWAKEQGGALPDRAEGALCYANNADAAFKDAWYWLEPQCAGASDYAWYQFFGVGYQFYDHKDTTNRARAVRRSPIQ